KDEQPDDHGPPDDRRGSGERQRGEHGDAGHAAQHIQPIGLERRESLEQTRDALRDRRHGRSDRSEDDRQRDPDRQATGGETAEEDEAGSRGGGGDRETRPTRREGPGATGEPAGTSPIGRRRGSRYRCRGTSRG